MSDKEIQIDDGVGILLSRIRDTILSSRNRVIYTINTLQVATNFEIGRLIVENEQKGADKAEYGKEIMKELAKKLSGEFGRGFSHSNLDYMRKFYLTYRDRLSEKSQMPSGKFINQTDGQQNLTQPFALS
jgi:predicted GNAT family N-acyltransferase